MSSWNRFLGGLENAEEGSANKLRASEDHESPKRLGAEAGDSHQPGRPNCAAASNDEGGKAGNLDDLLSFSSMTVEETRAAAAALIEMMQQVDAKHLARLRKLCR